MVLARGGKLIDNGKVLITFQKLKGGNSKKMLCGEKLVIFFRAPADRLNT